MIYYQWAQRKRRQVLGYMKIVKIFSLVLTHKEPILDLYIHDILPLNTTEKKTSIRLYESREDI